MVYFHIIEGKTTKQYVKKIINKTVIIFFKLKYFNKRINNKIAQLNINENLTVIDEIKIIETKKIFLKSLIVILRVLLKSLKKIKQKANALEQIVNNCGFADDIKKINTGEEIISK